MKTKLTLLVVCLTAIMVQTNAQWTNITTNSTKNLLSIAFSGDNGLIGGINGAILHSSDAGLTWVDSNYYSYDPIPAVAFASPTSAIAGTDMHLYTSVNSGTTFARPTSISGIGVVHDIVFTSSTTGYLVDDACRVAKTTDGGQNWTIGTHACSAYPSIIDMDFPTATTGYICGEEGSIYKTTDGASTWTAVTAPGDALVNYHTIQFLDANTGFVAGHSNNGNDSMVFKKTTDGGATWIDMKQGLSNAGVGYLSIVNEFAFANENLGYVIFENKIYKTVNGGTSWSLDYTSTVTDGANPYVFNKIIVSPNAVLAVGDHGLIARLDGGGNTTAVKEVKAPAEITVYPNPASAAITLGSFLVKNENAFLQITNAAGQVVRAEKISTNDVDISQLANGIYFGKLTGTNQSRYTFRFIKQ